MIGLHNFVKQGARLLLLPFVMALMALSVAQAAVSPSFSANAVGTTNNLTISIALNVGDSDVGQTGNFYAGFFFNDVWYFNSPQGWTLYESAPVPAYGSGVLNNLAAVLIADADFTPYIGAQLFLGYGLSESDMVDNGKYSHVYTITSESVTLGPAPVLLGASANYGILAKTAVSTVPTSAIIGDVGVSPAATTFLTGFSLTLVGTTSATSTQVIGTLFGGDMTPPTNSNLTTAVLDMEAAYTDAAGRPTPDQLNLGSGNIGGLTLPAGLYNWGSSVTIPSNLAISGGGNDVWIFQVTGDLSISANQQVILEGGAQAKNIFWQVAGEVIIEAGAQFKGNILSQTAITLRTGASLHGRALAQTMVALDSAIVTKPSQ